MKVTLRKKGKPVAEFEVGKDGALRISVDGKPLGELSARDSRRLAGVIIECSVGDTVGKARDAARGHAHRLLDGLLDQVDGQGDDE